MRRFRPLPDGLSARAFSTRDATQLGVTPDRLRARDLNAPFPGVRTAASPLTTIEACRAFAPRLRDCDVFSHVTAAQLWRIPLPLHRSGTFPLHVSSEAPARAIRVSRVAGHQLEWAPGEVTTLDGLPLSGVALAWCQLGESLKLPDLIAAAEFVITGNPYGDLLPLASIHELRAASMARIGGRGSVVRRQALEHAVVGALSRPESLLRLLLLSGGIPQPLINVGVTDEHGSFVAMPDLQWPEYQVAMEYEGDHHREQVRFRRDIRRIEALVDAGWLVVKASADDLFVHPDELVARVIRRLKSRGWRPTLRDLPKFGPIRP